MSARDFILGWLLKWGSCTLEIDDYGDPAGGRTISGTQQTPMPVATGTPPAGSYTTDGKGTYTFAAGDAGKTVHITYSFTEPTTTSSGQPLGALSLTLFPGSRPQSTWGYLDTNHPDQSLNYAGLAHVDAENIDLGVSATLPQLAFSVVGLLPFGGGIVDANPADVLRDIWTDPNHGLALAWALLGDLTQWSNYCVASGLFTSPVLDSQQSASQVVQELLDTTNSTASWWDGKLQLIPYGDTTQVGNGATYTPNTQPVYDLTDDDFTKNVQIARTDLADTFNAVQIEWVDRTNKYNTAICEEKNEDAVNKYGLRMDSVRSYHSITTSAVAAMAANAILKRNLYIVSTYQFSTDWRYCLLTPGDLVTLTDSRLGLVKTPVRITRVTENSDGSLDFEAEEFPWGTATATEYPKQAGAPYIPQSNVDPGDCNAPIIFESTSRQNNYQGYQLNIAVSGASSDWGGCSIWGSIDGSTYQQLGTAKNGANMGVLSAALAAGSDPDTTNTLSVDLSESLGQLTSASDAEADAAQTLCWVDGELISFGSATLTAANKYNLTYLRRGVFGSTNGAHANGAPFCRLDGAIVTCALDPDWVGKTIHLKFTSFNIYGKEQQSLADVAEYTYAITGSGPGAITADGKAGAGTVTWSALAGDASGDTSSPIADGSSKRLTHGAMSGAVQGVITSDGKVAAATVVEDQSVEIGDVHTRVAAGLDADGNVARELTSAIKTLIALTDLKTASLVLDNLADGTYGKPLTSRLSSGKPWIDFNEPIHLNKTTDYIGDGTGNPLAGGKSGYLGLTSGGLVALGLPDSIKALIALGELESASLLLSTLADANGYTKGVDGSHTEQVDNADFEASTALPPPGWQAGGGGGLFAAALSYDTTNPYNGKQSLEMVNCPVQYGVTSTRTYPVTPGDQYLLSCAMAASSGGSQGMVRLHFYDATGSTLASQPVQILSNNTAWTAYSVTATVPSGAAIAQLACGNVGTAPGTILLDAVRLSRLRGYGSEVWDDGLNGFYRLLHVADDNTFHASTALNNQGSIASASSNATIAMYAVGGAIASWAASTSYFSGDQVATSGGHNWQAVSNGTSGGSAPAAPAAIGDTVTDGSVTWLYLGTGILTVIITGGSVKFRDGSSGTVPNYAATFALNSTWGGTSVTWGGTYYANLAFDVLTGAAQLQELPDNSRTSLAEVYGDGLVPIIQGAYVSVGGPADATGGPSSSGAYVGL